MLPLSPSLRAGHIAARLLNPHSVQMMLIGLVSLPMLSGIALADIASLTGAFAPAPLRRPLDLRANGDNSGLTIWALEEQDVVLPRGVVVQATEPGYYDRRGDLRDRTIAAGTPVSSDYVYVRKGGTETPHDGEITFARRILGVIVLPSALTADSNFLGDPRVLYAEGTNLDLGLELEPIPHNDTFTISLDRRTLTVHLWCGTPGDRIRVLTLAAHAGDLNCDGALDAFDIEPFTLALFDPAGYAAQYPDCDRDLADVNADGNVDAFDIEPFIALLFGP